MKLYRAVAEGIGDMIRGGTLRAGEQLPSVRALCAARDVSPATVLRAYEALEAEGLVEARARSGYYVRAVRQPHAPRPSQPKASSTRLEVSDLVFQTLEASRDRETVPLGSAFPSPMLFPWPKLARFLGRSTRHMDPWNTVESLPPGSLGLRREIARRYLNVGMSVGIDQIITTAGALEALNLSLQAVVSAGDTIAIESPTFYGCLQAAQWLGLNVVEIPTHPTEGIDLDALKRAIAKHPIRACWLMTTLHHPTGATVPVDRKRELVRLLTHHDIALIEDDAYAELQFAPKGAPPAKAFDEAGLVLHCGSFSKCLAPGYRLGWVAAGRYAAPLARRKMEASIATSLPIQLGAAEYLRHGGYDAHLARLRRALEAQQAAALESLRRHFPPGYRVARPGGGYFLWVECAPKVDSLEVHQAALAHGITVAPGPIFSARREFRNYLRLNCGHPWTQAIDRAVQRLGQLLRRF
ncbi:MAG TPA: PLP-dependent aminotransferase family protein [Steroidobacteraceae bacterium]|jgi:DNA-binding transcriptional MocR family regulator|nr:PLP-dependent aminotransferase family protein [Steroidobacteraceae bacterium]